MYQTDQYEGMLAETVSVHGHNGDVVNAYLARPMGTGPFPAMVVIHHAPGWDEWYREATRRYAHHGYVAISPNLYSRDGHGTPEDIGAAVRAGGGVPDDQMVGDVTGAMKYLRSQAYVNGKGGSLRHLLRRAQHLPHSLPEQWVRRGHRVLGRARGHGRG